MTLAARQLIAAAKQLADERGHGEDWDAVIAASKVPPEFANALVMMNLVNGVEVPGELFGVIEIAYGGHWFFAQPGQFGFKP